VLMDKSSAWSQGRPKKADLRKPAPIWPQLALADRIIEAAVTQLRSYGSEPSPEHLRGIREASVFMGEMAYGAASSVIALSSMSTGMGKSEIAAATGRVLTSDPAYAAVGMIYLASTKRDLKSMIQRMGFNLGPDPRYDAL
jgi:hypothetical protein